jgi:hypothetical protein
LVGWRCKPEEAFAVLPVQGLSHPLDLRFDHNWLHGFKPATLFQFGFAVS